MPISRARWVAACARGPKVATVTNVATRTVRIDIACKDTKTIRALERATFFSPPCPFPQPRKVRRRNDDCFGCPCRDLLPRLRLRDSVPHGNLSQVWCAPESVRRYRRPESHERGDVRALP